MEDFIVEDYSTEFSNGGLFFYSKPKNERFWLEDKEYFLDLKIEKIFFFDNGVVIEVNKKERGEYPQDSWKIVLPNIPVSIDCPVEAEIITFDFSFKREIKERRKRR